MKSCRYYFLIILTLTIFGLLWWGMRKYQQMQKTFEKQLQSVKEEILFAMLAEKTDEICVGAKSEQEECLAIARWIAGHMVNIKQWQGSTASECYARRIGVCDARAKVFARMCAFRGIPVRIFNIYNFGGPSGGHSCAQAYYDNGWRFFDVTYAGVFMRDGKVLGWDEILEDPASAIAGMVVFEETLDRPDCQRDCDMPVSPRVSNKRRMESVYTVANIRGAARSAGFFGASDLKILEASLNLGEIPPQGLAIGKLDDDSDDADTDGMTKGVSQLLGHSLGNKIDTFHVRWNFSGARPGHEYALRYHLYKATHSGLEFWAKPEEVEILDGASFVSSWLLTHQFGVTWEIKFRPKNEKCRLTIGYEFREPGRLLYVDQIELHHLGAHN